MPSWFQRFDGATPLVVREWTALERSRAVLELPLLDATGVSAMLEATPGFT